jgi:hypothetical protein
MQNWLSIQPMFCDISDVYCKMQSGKFNKI